MSQTNEIATNQQWGGRFSEPTDAFVARFTASVDFDQRMYRQDIQGSVAHAKMLTHVGVLTQQECDDILRGLEEIRIEIERGDFTWSVALEDVHMNIEAALTTKIGMAGKKLHTGRSRNDQVATDIRLYCVMKSTLFVVKSVAYKWVLLAKPRPKMPLSCLALHTYKRHNL